MGWHSGTRPPSQPNTAPPPGLPGPGGVGVHTGLFGARQAAPFLRPHTAPPGPGPTCEDEQADPGRGTGSGPSSSEMRGQGGSRPSLLSLTPCGPGIVRGYTARCCRRRLSGCQPGPPSLRVRVAGMAAPFDPHRHLPGHSLLRAGGMCDPGRTGKWSWDPVTWPRGETWTAGGAGPAGGQEGRRCPSKRAASHPHVSRRLCDHVTSTVFAVYTQKGNYGPTSSRRD